MVKQITKICDWKTSVAFLHSVCTHVDGNKQTDAHVCMWTHVHLSSKSRCWYAFEWKVWFACIHAAQALASETDKPLFFCDTLNLKKAGVWNPVRKKSSWSLYWDFPQNFWNFQEYYEGGILSFLLHIGFCLSPTRTGVLRSVSKHLTKYTSFLITILTEGWKVNEFGQG